jgi:hypothetical protein
VPALDGGIFTSDAGAFDAAKFTIIKLPSVAESVDILSPFKMDFGTGFFWLRIPVNVTFFASLIVLVESPEYNVGCGCGGTEEASPIADVSVCVSQSR